MLVEERPYGPRGLLITSRLLLYGTTMICFSATYPTGRVARQIASFERPVETQDAINLLARQLVLAVVMVVVEVVEVKGSARSVASWWRGRKSKRSQGLARKWNRAMGSVLLVGRSVGQREG